MRVATILSLAAAALAAPLADPMPAPTANAEAAPIAAPEPTAAPEPQGFGVTTPWGGFSVGAPRQGPPPPQGYRQGPPPQQLCNGVWRAANCIYSGISTQVVQSISAAISSGVDDAFGYGATSTINSQYYPTGQPGWAQSPPQPGWAQEAPQPYQNQPYQNQGQQQPPYAANPYNSQPTWAGGN